MGTELSGQRAGDGAKMKADIQDDHVVFRGAVKAEVPFEDIVAESRGTLLVLSFAGTTVELGAGAKAAALAAKVRSPPGRLDRLRLEVGQTVALAGPFDAAFRRELETRVLVASGVPTSPVDAVLWLVEAPAALSSLPKLAPLVAPGGSLWVVVASGRSDLRAEQVAAAARQAGLKEAGTARLPPAQVAVRLAKA